jgi:hypothetical protein
MAIDLENDPLYLHMLVKTRNDEYVDTTNILNKAYIQRSAHTIKLLMDKYNVPVDKKQSLKISIGRSPKLFDALYKGFRREDIWGNIGENTLLAKLDYELGRDIGLITLQKRDARALTLLLKRYPLNYGSSDVGYGILKIIGGFGDDRYTFLKAFTNGCLGTNLGLLLSKVYLTWGNITPEEQEVFIQISSVYNLDAMVLEKLLPQRAYQLYINNLNIPGAHERIEYLDRYRLLVSLFDIPELLEKALGYLLPPNFNNLIESSLGANRSAFDVLTKFHEVSTNEILQALPKAVTKKFNPTTVIYVCNQHSITLEDVELIVATSDLSIVTGQLVQCYIDLGLRLNGTLLGEVLVFRCNGSGWNKLAATGYNFRGIGKDLSLHVVFNNPTLFKDLTKHYDEYDKELYYATEIYNNAKSRKATIITAFNKGDLKVIGKVLLSRKTVIPWDGIISYTWLDDILSTVVRDRALAEGISIMKEQAHNFVLRGLCDLKYWLMLASGMTKKVTVADNVITIDVDIPGISTRQHNTTITMPIIAKYRGLDMFSCDGVPLQTRQQIKDRRNEIKDMVANR